MAEGGRMAFRDWMNEMFALKSRFSEVSESINVNGHGVAVIIRETTVSASIDGAGCELRELRPYYTHNKDAFAGMLDMCRERCRASADVEAIAEEVALYNSLPEAVLERLKGEDTGTPDEMLHKVVAGKLKEFEGVIDLINQVFHRVHFVFPEIGGATMQLNDNGFYVGGLSIQNGNTGTSSVSFADRLMFLANADIIATRLEEFLALAKQMKEIGGQADE